MRAPHIAWAVFAFCAAAAAAERDGEVRYGTGPDGSAFYYQKDRVRATPGGLEVWVRTVLGKADSYQGRPYHVSRARYLVDCTSYAFEITQVALYNDRGESVGSTQERGDPRSPVPGSMGDSLLKAVCNQAPPATSALDLEEAMLDRTHPGWRRLMGSPAFGAWLAKQPAALQQKCKKATTADEAGACIDRFLQSK